MRVDLKLQDTYLKLKYEEKVYNCKMKILKCFSDLQDAEKYQYSKYEPIKLNFLFSKMKLYEEEAKCDVQKSIIYLNHSVLDADNTTLTRVLIHELIHINYPNLKGKL